MHPDATDSSGAGLSPASATGASGRPTPGARDERRPESRGHAEAAAAAVPRDPGGSNWRVAVAVAALAAVALSFLAPGCWETAGGAGPCTVLLRLILYLSCAAAAFLLGTLSALVCRSRRAPPPDFVATWNRLAAAVRRPPGVSTGLGLPRAHGGLLAALPASGASRRLSGTPLATACLSSRAAAPHLEAGSPREMGLGGVRAGQVGAILSRVPYDDGVGIRVCGRAGTQPRSPP